MTAKAKKKKLAPPWNFVDVKPPTNAALVFFDGTNVFVGVWTDKLGKVGEGGFATVTRKVNRDSSISTKLALVENVRSWMIIPDQTLEPHT